jgi:hypothetical protein
MIDEEEAKQEMCCKRSSVAKDPDPGVSRRSVSIML